MVQIPLHSGPQAVAQQQPASPLIVNEIEDPLNGEIISVDDIDGLIDCLERAKGISQHLYAVMTQVRIALAKKTEGDAKTRRVQGKRRRAKIEMPDDSWEQPLLKEAFHSYPQYRDTVLKIDTVGVKLREFKKLINTTGDESFNQFRNMVTSANRGQTGTPTVTIEV